MLWFTGCFCSEIYTYLSSSLTFRQISRGSRNLGKYEFLLGWTDGFEGNDFKTDLLVCSGKYIYQCISNLQLSYFLNCSNLVISKFL